MKTGLPFDFTIDKKEKTVTMTREFDAELELVWDAFTKKEILDQWWAPRPWMARTKIMDFKEGGRRFYAMVGPDGQERWQVQKYTSITPKTNFKYWSAFADQDENTDDLGSNWDFSFTGDHDRTKVTITIKNESLERMERMIEMGFDKGMAATLNSLDELLVTLKRSR